MDLLQPCPGIYLRTVPLGYKSDDCQRIGYWPKPVTSPFSSHCEVQLRQAQRFAGHAGGTMWFAWFAFFAPRFPTKRKFPTTQRSISLCSFFFGFLWDFCCHTHGAPLACLPVVHVLWLIHQILTVIPYILLACDHVSPTSCTDEGRQPAGCGQCRAQCISECHQEAASLG